MKLTTRTLQILRNFSTINPSIAFKEGYHIATMAPMMQIMAKAKTDTYFERSFAISELAQFLGAVSMFDDPELNPGETSVKIVSGTECLNYTYSDPKFIVTPPEKDIILPTIDVNFELKQNVLNRTLKAMSIVNAPEIAITGDGECIHLETLNTKRPSSPSYKVQVGVTDKKFKFIFLAENMKIITGDYNVEVSSQGFVAHFTGEDVEYWVAAEENSSYNG